MSATPSPNDGRAVGTAVACYTLWGLLPLLFMAMAAHGFGAPEILAHRAVWSVFVAGLVLLLAGQWGEARRVLATPRTRHHSSLVKPVPRLARDCRSDGCLLQPRLGNEIRHSERSQLGRRP